MDVNLGDKDKARCEKQFTKDGMVNYQEAMRFLGINPGSEEWEFRNLCRKANAFVNPRSHHTMRNVTPKGGSLERHWLQRRNSGESDLSSRQLDRLWQHHSNTIQFD